MNSSTSASPVYIMNPSKGCEAIKYDVSGSSNSITPVVGGTVTKKAGCSDPRKDWDITPDLSA